MNSLAERMKFALENSNLKNQNALVRACGISAPSVCNWFNGETTELRGENLLKAAKTLGVSPEWLATGKGRMEADMSPLALVDASVPELLEQLFEKTDNCSSSVKEAAISMTSIYLQQPDREDRRLLAKSIELLLKAGAP